MELHLYSIIWNQILKSTSIVLCAQNCLVFMSFVHPCEFSDFFYSFGKNVIRILMEFAMDPQIYFSEVANFSIIIWRFMSMRGHSIFWCLLQYSTFFVVDFIYFLIVFILSLLFILLRMGCFSWFLFWQVWFSLCRKSTDIGLLH